MNTIDTMRVFSDGRMSAHDVRALLVSMGHSKEDCAEAFGQLVNEPGASVRVGAYQKGEFYAEIYLTASVDGSTPN